MYAGKSSFCNKILGFERTIVSDIAGTTRDAIDTPFTYNDKKYMIIDTQTGRQPKIIEHFSLANMTYIYFLKLKIYTHILCICSMYMFIKYYELFLKLLHIYII